jgi:hypothetical protein
MFKLEIALGNDAMQTADDVGRALIEIAKGLHAIGDFPLSLSNIRDDNGNTVGNYYVSRPRNKK